MSQRIITSQASRAFSHGIWPQPLSSYQLSLHLCFPLWQLTYLVEEVAYRRLAFRVCRRLQAEEGRIPASRFICCIVVVCSDFEVRALRVDARQADRASSHQRLASRQKLTVHWTCFLTRRYRLRTVEYTQTTGGKALGVVDGTAGAAGGGDIRGVQAAVYSHQQFLPASSLRGASASIAT